LHQARAEITKAFYENAMQENQPKSTQLQVELTLMQSLISDLDRRVTDRFSLLNDQ
jgi:hypothetical protein